MTKGFFTALIITLFIAGLFCSLASANTTEDRFRCPNGAFVAVNDRLTTVMMKCDPPTMATKRMVTADPMGTGNPVTIEVEEWVYNLGSTSFVYYLIFNNGILKRIEESSEYGY